MEYFLGWRAVIEMHKKVQDYIELIRLIYRTGELSFAEMPFTLHFYHMVLLFLSDIGLLLIFVVIDQQYSSSIRILSGIGFGLSLFVVTIGFVIPYIAGIMHWVCNKRSKSMSQ